MVDNINGARAPSAQAQIDKSAKSAKQAKDSESLTKSFDKLSNKPELVQQIAQNPSLVKSQVGIGKQSLNKLQDAVSFSKDALESVKKLSGPGSSESEATQSEPNESISELADGPGKSQKSEIMQLAKDLDALKSDIKALFESLKEKTDQVTVVDSNLEAAQASPEDLNRVVSIAKEAGSEIRFKPRDALSAHNSKINPESVDRLLTRDTVLA